MENFQSKSLIPSYSNQNIFDFDSFVFWSILTTISFILFVKVFYIEEKGTFYQNSISFMLIIGLIILALWVTLRVNIEEYILVFKTKIENDVEQIIFKKDESSKEYKFITEPNTNKYFNKESVKNIFKDRFSKSLDDLEHNIEGPFLYKNKAKVFYISVNLDKPLLSGMDRYNQNYRPVLIEDLIEYKNNKSDVRLEYKYNKNVLPILVDLHKNYLKKILVS